MDLDLKKEIPILINKFKSNRYDEVINKCLTLLKHNHSDFLWNLLGMCFQNIFQYKKSIDCFQNAIKINPKNFSAYNNLGITYKNLRNYKDAELNLSKALNINSSYINALVNLGNLKNDTFYFNDAIIYYKKALDIDPNNSLLYLNLATTYQSINQIDEAKNYLNKALKIDDMFTVADHKLSLLENYNKKNVHLEKMNKKLQTKELKDNDKVNLYFAIAKALEDCEDYKKSIEYLKLGNRLQRSLINYNKKFYTELKEKIKLLFSKINPKKLENNNQGKNNIFIIGMPRSGTTLLEKIISSHSKVSTISETNFISDKISGYFYNDKEHDIDKFLKYVNSDFSSEYKNFINLFNINSEKILDKTLSNFWYIGFIKIIFPNSKIIHSLRNPKDNCLSIYKNLFDTHEGWLYDEDELKSYYKNYQEIMSYWNDIFGNDILNFRYEDLIKNPKTRIEKLLNYCDLEWEENCLNFHNNKNPIKTLSVNQANKPIYKTSIKKSDFYKEDLSSLFSNLD